MTKIIALALISALTLFPNQRNRRPSRSTAAPPEMEVMVLFSGLMVFNVNPNTRSYEVGILSHDDAHKHRFCIERQGVLTVCREELPTWKNWILRVTNEPGGPPVAVGHGNQRRPDHPTGQYDFDWIIDLDGPEFHRDGLTLLEGHLNPIIQLPKAKMFTMYKSPDFERWQGEDKKSASAFGFVAETVGFRVSLNSGEEMVLEAKEGGQTKEIFKIPYVPPAPIGGNYRLVTISNTRYPPPKDSDFGNYYNLFTKRNGSQIPDSEKYDFRPKTTGAYQAYNPLPTYPFEEYKTCCGLVCSQVRLVQWGSPLH